MLLIKLMGFQIANTGVTAVVVVVVNILGDATLGVGKDGPVAGVEFLSFEVGPQAFRLCVVVAFAPPAVRKLGLGPA